MGKSRTGLLLGTALVGGAGYYLYSAGGDPKAAEKQFEHDLQTARAKALSTGKQAQTEAEKYSAQATAQAEAALSKANEAAKDAQAQLNKSAEALDKKVEEAASKTKSSWSSWFGGK